VRNKKSWRCEEFLKKINNIRLASHKFIRKTEIIQENLLMNVAFVLTKQMSNRRIRNNRNHNNQTTASVPTEEVLAKEFYYDRLTSDKVTALY
jgi:hypothetical protein